MCAPAIRAMRDIIHKSMPLTSGTKLGTYEIQSPLHAGGMREVHRPRDTQLGCDLAKLAQKASAATSDGATMTSSHTAMGVVMGTASYMAPEQVRGEQADPRTDIFAFGAVLYEMISGERAFRRDTPAETMTAVLKDDPSELSDLGHGVSPALERIVRRCLEKSPEQRFQSARDLSFALSALSGSEASGA